MKMTVEMFPGGSARCSWAALAPRDLSRWGREDPAGQQRWLSVSAGGWGGEAWTKAALWYGGSWISLAFRGFNKGLKGAGLFWATETCCLLASGSLLAAGGVWGCWVPPAEHSRCRVNAALRSPLVHHPAPLRGLAVTCLCPEPQPAVPVVRLFPWRSPCLPCGVRRLKALLLRQPGLQHPLSKRRGFEAGV